MSNEERYEIAKKYVDDQLDVMKKFDAATKISASEYKSLIERIAQTIQPEAKKARAAAR